MNTLKHIAVASVILATFYMQVCAQGCSDSGFCTMGALKPDQIFARKINFKVYAIEITQHLGHTKYGDWIHATFADVNIGITQRTSLQLRLPAYAVITGPMPTTTGWGDMFFTLSQNIFASEKFQVNATLGTKIFNRWAVEKKSDDGLSMPLYQQPSYGSNDIIGGVALTSRNYLFALGYQRVLNPIKNQFRPEAWADTPLHNVIQQYDASAGLQRGDDLMIRAERNFRFAKWSFFTGVLNLIRLTKDTGLNTEGQRVSISGTQGLASSILAGARYRINVKNSVKVLWAVTVAERAVNPDGLNRDFVGQLAYEIRF